MRTVTEKKYKRGATVVRKGQAPHGSLTTTCRVPTCTFPRCRCGLNNDLLKK